MFRDLLLPLPLPLPLPLFQNHCPLAASYMYCRQVLDRLQVEQERGVTVRAHTATMLYEYKGQSYLLNLIDTPGHVDFNYEVKCSLAACQVGREGRYFVRFVLFSCIYDPLPKRRERFLLWMPPRAYKRRPLLTFTSPSSGTWPFSLSSIRLICPRACPGGSWSFLSAIRLFNGPFLATLLFSAIFIFKYAQSSALLCRAQVELTTKQLHTLFDIDGASILHVSAKSGLAVDSILPTVIDRVPPPPGRQDAPLRALLFDSWYNEFRGVVMLLEVG